MRMQQRKVKRTLAQPRSSAPSPSNCPQPATGRGETEGPAWCCLLFARVSKDRLRATYQYIPLERNSSSVGRLYRMFTSLDSPKYILETVAKTLAHTTTCHFQLQSNGIWCRQVIGHPPSIYILGNRTWMIRPINHKTTR